MMDERITHLIQAGIDRELDEAGQVEFDRLMADSDEARTLKGELESVGEILSGLEPQEPPEALHGRIMSSISLPEPKRFGFRFSEIPGFARYAMTAAAGLLLAVGLYEFRPGALDGDDFDNMVGTIMRDRQVQGVALDRFSFDIEQLTSEVTLLEREDALVLDVRIDSDRPVEITLDFTSDGLMFDAIAQMRSDLSSIEFADQAIQVKSSGRQHFAVMLHRDENRSADTEASIKLQYSSRGNVVREEILVTR